MSEALTAAALVALSVSALEAALAEGNIAADVIDEALELEKAKSEPRKTAVEALEAAQVDALDLQEPKEPAGFYVENGKSLTSKVGIKDAGQTVTADMFVGGEETLKRLVKKRYIREVK